MELVSGFRSRHRKSGIALVSFPLTFINIVIFFIFLSQLYFLQLFTFPSYLKRLDQGEIHPLDIVLKVGTPEPQ